MAGYLRNILTEPELVLEEHSMTTLENLVFARALAEHHAGVVERFVVFCDRVHRRKVATLAKMILGGHTIVQSVDHQVTMRVRLFEPISHLIETLAAGVPPLRKYLRAAAIRIKGVSEKSARSLSLP